MNDKITTAVKHKNQQPAWGEENRDCRNALQGLGVALVIGILGVSIFAYSKNAGNFLNFVSIGVLLAGASMFAGGTVGFLFGVPRSQPPMQGISDTDISPTVSGNAEKERRLPYIANTNLEQISDWLTKILVGVSLTQLGDIRINLRQLTHFVARGLGEQPDQARVFVFVVIVYFLLIGFFFAWLWTRVFLTKELARMDNTMLNILGNQIKGLKEHAELDATALQIVNRQLNQSSSIPQVKQEELDAVIAAASQQVKAQIFYQAATMRSNTWKDQKTKTIMERTIPVFRSLIKDDKAGRFHMNHGQLGFALKDRLQPEWAEAEKELSTAIELRKQSGQTGWLLYEFNRALCIINLDIDFIEKRTSNPDIRTKILDDLRVAARSEKIKQIMESDEMLQRWFSLNSMKSTDIRSD